MAAVMSPVIRRVVAALSTLLVAGAARAAPADVRVMTYNIRLDIASDGGNAWSQRRDWVIAQIDWLDPDVFGMQEVLPNQRADLAAALPRYRLSGEGRDGEGRGEASPLAFDTRRFDLVDGGTFWLSATPEVPSMGWDAAYKRVATWARLRARGTKHVLLAVNTHWDNVGAVARRESARQIGGWIETHRRPCERVVVLGDFNSEIGSEPLANLRATSTLRDARAVSKTAPFGPAVTFNGFRNPPEGAAAIDHVLPGEGIDVERYLVLSQLIDGRWPSDHFPVIVDLSLADCR
jgi:endonuclease/exonuclease/phosphatase family metal-dependent hydrolase